MRLLFSVFLAAPTQRGIVTRLLLHPTFRFFADLRLAAVILAAFAIAAAIGTWIESHYANLGSIETGRAAVFELVYDAPWFNALLGLLFVNLRVNLVRQLLVGRRPAGFLLVHASMLVILVGAGITRWWGYEGMLRIREGQANNLVASSEVFAVAAVGDEEGALPVRLYRPGAQSHSKPIELDGESFTLGVEEFWPRFQSRLEPGPGGFAHVEFAVRGPEDIDLITLRQGEDLWVGSVMVRFHAGALPDSSAGPEPEFEGANSVDLARRNDAVVMRASFPFEVGSMRDGGGSQLVPAGEVVRLEASRLIRGRAGFQVMVNAVETSMVDGGALSTDPDAPAAARIYVEKDGQRASAICVQNALPEDVELDGRTIQLRYGSVFSELPYEIFLVDFVLNTYPGSDIPRATRASCSSGTPSTGSTTGPGTSG